LRAADLRDVVLVVDEEVEVSLLRERVGIVPM
jgi:hypothetical protein